MKLYDLGQKGGGLNRMMEARHAALEGEQALVITRRGGREVGLLIDRDVLRLSRTMRRLGLGVSRLSIHRGGLYVVHLESGDVARARSEIK
ncbi:hypothetical protein V6C53_00435 [Desulfocurvibacter africanus]|uniref:Uncharacterized protein n=1 Tax=Desulfocurvibacter africanus subsp. africanus str. Walvis Bay TaxID=690850 RepID=F3Z3D8_DESAF|nr:hypothetical protein [Desulfocurvibacter africanus]EGJ51478.1 hypothetical protein Desaf_3183 [Desulfocurvibacter africanus subsp. africanus str. Walvis Bay]